MPNPKFEDELKMRLYEYVYDNNWFESINDIKLERQVIQQYGRVKIFSVYHETKLIFKIEIFRQDYIYFDTLLCYINENYDDSIWFKMSFDDYDYAINLIYFD
jgi:hypothetical protein